jgi:hypothetical protein
VSNETSSHLLPISSLNFASLSCQSQSVILQIIPYLELRPKAETLESVQISVSITRTMVPSLLTTTTLTRRENSSTLRIPRPLSLAFPNPARPLLCRPLRLPPDRFTRLLTSVLNFVGYSSSTSPQVSFDQTRNYLKDDPESAKGMHSSNSMGSR